MSAQTRRPDDAWRIPCEDQGVTEDNGRQIVAEQLYATLKTNHGDIQVRLLPNHAPKTVRNFVELAKGEREWTDPTTGRKSTEKLYDGTVFHRVISGFMIQGGDPLGNGTGGPGYKFDDEIHPDLAFDKPYLLAMANAGRGPDGSGTNGSQFFITVAPTAWLNRKHTIFGEVTDAGSQKVVDSIATAQTNPRTDRPVNDVVIESVVVETRQG
jgi:peptidyl-prolyl cis-trans isomerase A (cyclophilin A)